VHIVVTVIVKDATKTCKSSIHNSVAPSKQSMIVTLDKIIGTYERKWGKSYRSIDIVTVALVVIS